MAKTRVVQDEPRAKCRFCWKSWSAVYVDSHGMRHEGMDSLQMHVVGEHWDQMSDQEYRALTNREEEVSEAA